jgi:hypothetical protein
LSRTGRSRPEDEEGDDVEDEESDEYATMTSASSEDPEHAPEGL